MERREIKDSLDYETLPAWAKEMNVTLGEAIPTDKAKYDLLQLLWIYQDVGAIHLKGIPPTDLIIHRIKLREETKVHNAKHKKLSQDCEWSL